MVKITNGIDIFEVTKGAFSGIYSHQGYSIIEEEDVIDVDAKDIDEPELTEDEIFLNELMETPLGNWNKAEVKRFCELKGIDLSGTKNVAEGKEVIKAYLDEIELQKTQDAE